MATLSRTQLLKDLQSELETIELQLQDTTLPHSDQQLLDQAWDDTLNQIDALKESYEAWQAYINRQENEWYDAGEYYEEEEDEPPQRTITIAPPPPSVTLSSGFTREGTVMAQLPTGRWVSAPLPLRIQAPTTEREEQSDAYELEDDRQDCRYCAGCAYCEESSAYDGTDEV